jgi:two-component system sensor histidine kinase GlrK
LVLDGWKVSRKFFEHSLRSPRLCGAESISLGFTQYAGESSVKFTIFRRIIMVPFTLLVCIGVVGLFAVTYLDRVTELNTQILTVDIACIQEAKRLAKTFLGEMRNAEKFLVLQDQEFHAASQQARKDVMESLSRIAMLADTDHEMGLLAQIRDLHDRYTQEAGVTLPEPELRKQVRTEISDGLIEKTSELIRFREQTMEAKATRARDEAVNASSMIAWLVIGGTMLAFLLAYVQARSISRPLNLLAREMRRLGRGESVRTLAIKAPPEVRELSSTFYSMAEELAELDRLKSDFTAHVSHELRTPLTAIREGTALMLEAIPGPLTPAQTEILEVVREHSERLHASISSILDLSKMEEEMMDYEITPCDLSAVIQRSVANIGLIAERRRVMVGTACSQKLPIVHADERRIQQVLENLLSNALKFAPEGGRVHVRAEPSPSDSPAGKVKQVEVRVSDNGGGIPDSDLERVFTKFYQSPQHGTQKHRGTGLGLAIARHVVHAHGGKIWVESQVGKGSTFVFTIPVNRGAAARLKQSSPGDMRQRA